jgi:hypothetical protein
MEAIRTEAVVDKNDQLKLLASFPNLKQGKIVDVIILFDKARERANNWKQILSSIGTYSEDELSGFYDAKREIDNWTPKEF